jgi:hypothetical protein
MSAFFLSVLSCVGSARETDSPPFKESHQLSIRSIISELILKRDQANGRRRWRKRRNHDFTEHVSYQELKSVFGKGGVMTPGGHPVTVLDPEVLMEVIIRIVMPCSLEKIRCFGRTYCLHLQGRRVRHARNSRSRGFIRTTRRINEDECTLHSKPFLISRWNLM